MSGFGHAHMQGGWIEVVCGPMFSGKTEELIRRVRRSQIARQRVQVFKPQIDTRYHETNVVSHSSLSEQAIPVQNSLDIFTKLYDSTRVIAIDEVQFFDDQIVTVVKKLARRGYRVICAGLDLDYRGVAFGPMPELLAIADNVKKISAICTICGAQATKTYRKIKSNDKVLLGETDIYEARCPVHFEYDVEEDELLPLDNEIPLPASSPEQVSKVRN